MSHLNFRDVAVSAQKQFLEYIVNKWAEKNQD